MRRYTSSLRGYVERNAIALLTMAGGVGSVPSAEWLGHHAQRDAIRTSGLWNVNHVGEGVEGDFLQHLSRIVDPSTKVVGGLPAAQPKRRPTLARSSHDGRPAAERLPVGSRPKADDFKTVLDDWLSNAARSGRQYLDVRSGDLHREVGGYPGTNHAMPICCHVMRRAMRPGDQELQAPPKGLGATVVIRYVLPR